MIVEKNVDDCGLIISDFNQFGGWGDLEREGGVCFVVGILH